MRERAAVVDAPVGGSEEMDARAARREQATHGQRDPALVNPVKGLGERHHGEGPQRAGQLLCPHMPPADAACPDRAAAALAAAIMSGSASMPTASRKNGASGEVSAIPGPQPTSSRPRPDPSSPSAGRSASARAAGYGMRPMA